jgi:hypothetical protein
VKDEQKENLLRKIRALLSKTVENGCTEDEAIKAAEKAAELLARYDLGMDEIEMGRTPFTQTENRYYDLVGERLWRPASAISKLTQTRYWQSRAGVHPVEITFFGFDHEVKIGSYLLAICARAMKDGQQALEHENRLKDPAWTRRQSVAFLDGMAVSLHRRILALIPPRPTGTGLVVLRFALIDAELARRKKRTSRGRTRRPRSHDPAYELGMAAGNRVALNPGVGGRTGHDAVIDLEDA